MVGTWRCGASQGDRDTRAATRSRFTQVAAGYGHACAISQGRSEIWCWGTNAYGEAGLPARTPYEVPDWAPTRVLAPIAFKKIVAGGEHTCAIGSTGVDVVCFGRDDFGVNQTKGTSYTQFPAGTGQFYFQQFGGLTSILDVGNFRRQHLRNAALGRQLLGTHKIHQPGGVRIAAIASRQERGTSARSPNQLASCVGTEATGASWARDRRWAGSLLRFR